MNQATMVAAMRIDEMRAVVLRRVAVVVGLLSLGLGGDALGQSVGDHPLPVRGSERAPVEIIPTGSIALDVALGVGGLPRGRIIEIYGPEFETAFYGGEE